MKRTILFFSLFLALSLPTSAKDKKIHGYVTNVISPTVIEIEDYRITRDQSLVLELDKGQNEGSIDFRPGDIRVGTELEIKGEYNEKTGELQAKSIRVFLEDYKRIKRTALIERQPLLKRANDGWEGTFIADGEHLHVQPSTKVLFKPNKSEEKLSKARRKQGAHAAKSKGEPPGPVSTDQENDAAAQPLESLDQVRPNTFMTYEGHRQPDGSIDAMRIVFVRNELERGEAKLWKELEPRVKEPNYRQGKPGEIKIRGVGKFKLVPNEEVQKYVQSVGEGVIPRFQKDLPAEDPNKIHFRFYVVDVKQPNAFALANGVVVVHSAMFDVLENEAQLAAVLGHEVTHSFEEHTWREHEYHKKKLMALRIGGAFAAGMGAYGIRDIATLVEVAVRNGYSRSLENQADREGLQNMIEAGYDPREAPRVWKLMTKKYGDQPTNFFWSSHDSHTVRRSYLMAELRNNYANLNFDQLRKNESEFALIARSLREASAKKKKVKVKY